VTVDQFNIPIGPVLGVHFIWRSPLNADSLGLMKPLQPDHFYHILCGDIEIHSGPYGAQQGAQADSPVSGRPVSVIKIIHVAPIRIIDS
jgi:hypothetical protein